MRNLLKLTTAALALVMAAGPAAAQDKAVASKSDARTARLVQSMGHCIARGIPEESHEFVTMDHRARNYRARARELVEFSKSCEGFRRGFAASSLIYAGAVAEGLLVDQGLLDDLAATTAFDADGPPIEARSAEDIFAFCMIRRDPEGISRLLRTEIVSDEELAQLKALAAHMPSCVPAGQQPKFTREAMRSLFALAAYRLHAHRLANGS